MAAVRDFHSKIKKDETKEKVSSSFLDLFYFSVTTGLMRMPLVFS